MRYFINRFQEFHQIYNFDAFWANKSSLESRKSELSHESTTLVHETVVTFELYSTYLMVRYV